MSKSASEFGEGAGAAIVESLRNISWLPVNDTRAELHKQVIKSTILTCGLVSAQAYGWLGRRAVREAMRKKLEINGIDKGQVSGYVSALEDMQNQFKGMNKQDAVELLNKEYEVAMHLMASAQAAYEIANQEIPEGENVPMVH